MRIASVFLLAHLVLSDDLVAFRPPAIPLLTTDPFTQTWIRGDTSTSATISHWDGAEKQMLGLLSIDGSYYRFLGNDSTPALTQRSLQALPTRTEFILELPDVLELKLTFLQTLFTDDMLRLSRPVYYVSAQVSSLDQKSHHVVLYLDASAQHVVNTYDQQVAWSSWTSNGFNGVKIGSAEQKVLGSKGDGVNIDWGYLHMASPSNDSSTTLYAGSAQSTRASFLSSSRLPASPDLRMPRACQDDLPVLATVHDFGSIDSPSTHTILLAYDDVKSVYYFGSEFGALWTHSYTNISDAIASAAEEVDDMLAKSTKHDDSILQALNATGGPEYAALCALAYRQTLAATKLVWNPNRNQIWNFLKEISTNGDMSTMDVIYPGSPMYVLLWYSLEVFAGCCSLIRSC